MYRISSSEIEIQLQIRLCTVYVPNIELWDRNTVPYSVYTEYRALSTEYRALRSKYCTIFGRYRISSSEIDLQHYIRYIPNIESWNRNAAPYFVDTENRYVSHNFWYKQNVELWDRNSAPYLDTEYWTLRSQFSTIFGRYRISTLRSKFSTIFGRYRILSSDLEFSSTFECVPNDELWDRNSAAYTVDTEYRALRSKLNSTFATSTYGVTSSEIKL